MEQEKTNINVTPQDQLIQKFISDNYLKEDEGKVITIRTGEAPTLLDAITPNKVHLTGTIKAPSEFYKKRKDLHNPAKCHVLYDKNKQTITLIVDEQYKESNYQVTGKIELNPDLDQFKINKGAGAAFTIKGLMEVIKFTRMFFADMEAQAAIVMSLQNFKAKIEHAIEDTTNNRGNETQSKITKLENDLMESFVLIMPVFKGGDNVKFKVEILCQVRDREVAVWLQSTELKEVMMTSIDSIMNKELETFADIVCIEQ